MYSAHPDTGRERGQDVVVGEGQHRSHHTGGEPWQQLQSCCLHQHITNVATHNRDSTALAASLSLQAPPPTPGRKGKNNFGKLVTLQAADVWICSSVLLLWQEIKTKTTPKNPNPTLFTCLFEHMNFLYLIMATCPSTGYHQEISNIYSVRNFYTWARSPWDGSRVKWPSSPKLSITYSFAGLSPAHPCLSVYWVAQHCSDGGPELLSLSSASWSRTDQMGVMEGNHRVWFKL